MQTSLLIFGSSRPKREDKARQIASENSGQFDLTIHDCRENNTIEGIRETIGQLSRKPFGSQLTTAIFLEAQLLSIESQNTLLKALEEPSPSTQIILTTPNPFGLIPTISSRCQSLDLGKTDQEISEAERQNFEAFWKQNLPGKINFAESLDLENWEVFWREKLLVNAGRSNAGSIVVHLKAIEKTKEFIDKKANVKLAKINLILDTPTLVD